MLVPKVTSWPSPTAKSSILFSNTGDEASPALTAMPEADIETSTRGPGAGHQSSSANPDESQAAEDGFAGGIADLLNKRVLDGEISDLIIIAAPRTLGELRKSYHKKLSEVLRGEIPKDLTGHAVHDIERGNRCGLMPRQHGENRTPPLRRGFVWRDGQQHARRFTPRPRVALMRRRPPLWLT